MKSVRSGSRARELASPLRQIYTHNLEDARGAVTGSHPSITVTGPGTIRGGFGASSLLFYYPTGRRINIC